MNKVYLLLGSNMGDRLAYLVQAMALIQTNVGKIKTHSKIYETPAWGNPNQADFLNQVLLVETPLAPTTLLIKTQAIEKTMGRIKAEQWGERIIDIDVLYYNDLVFHSEQLTIPHALIQYRRFVLEPLVEIAPNYVHPKLKLTNQALLEQYI